MVFCKKIKAQVVDTGSDSDAQQDTAQPNTERLTYYRPAWKEVEINFLNSYYTQDGNNSPVTGGIGTEFLTDFAQKISVSVPMKEGLKINFDVGYDYYTSASTDNIDNIRSSESRSDLRAYGGVGLDYQIDANQKLGFRIGGSTEYDYRSLSLSVNHMWESLDRNTILSASLQAFIDKWELFYPRELRQRGRQLVPTDKRQSYNGSLSWVQNINPKMRLSLQAEFIYMRGLLSTPFHRVYFQDRNEARIENLPASRLKIPLGIRINNYLTPKLISRFYYRYYQDDWGIKAHTTSIELPVKINRFTAIYPYYRFHSQSGADYFLPFQEHLSSSEFYSSDYDLADLTSHAYGLGFSFDPVNGLGALNLPLVNSDLVVKGIDVKIGRYTRNTDFVSYIVSLGVSFGIK